MLCRTALLRSWLDPHCGGDMAVMHDELSLLALGAQDCPVPIGYGATISAPHMHSKVLELLEPKLQPGARVLDVGSGSGYLTAVLGRLVGPRGSVLGVEKMEPLARRSIQSIQARRKLLACWE